ncbi:MAG TPA: chemoreceptor glutamine deamidase CheD [Burkholderiales bacterium]|nr:chemoreceptor glutamine deamidase CheD [Burkholderiales bacterium]
MSAGRALSALRAEPEALDSSPAPDSFARNEYFDRAHARQAAKLLPGEYYVTGSDMLLVTVLGSCVAACIRDAETGVGGMNHFMLPDSDLNEPVSASARYGTYAMEVLINHLLKLGARRDRLEAKVFGGGNVLPGLIQANVGHKNAAFVTAYLRTEQIRIAAKDLADVHPRKVYYFPATGRVLVKRLLKLHNDTVLTREIDYRQRMRESEGGGGVELFT